jgi:hypothetical protein
MQTEIDRAPQFADDVRRQLVGALGLATLGIAMLGLDGLCRVLKNFTTFDDCSNEFDRRDHPDEFDEGGERTLYEIIYFDRRLKSYWPVGFYPELSDAVSAVMLADDA